MPQEDDFYVIDGHCDTLMRCTRRGMNASGSDDAWDFFSENERAHIDLPKLKKGHVACQFMAIFLEDDQILDGPEHANRMIDAFQNLLEDPRAKDRFLFAKNATDIKKAIEKKQVSAFLSIEGAEALGSSLDTLDAMHQRGVRALGLTWNRTNAFGRGQKGQGTDGLTPLGKKLVEKMADMRMIIDVSHLSEEGFWEVSDIHRGPFIASHANARSIVDHQRNLSDEQIRAIADHGGAIGCVFVPYFVSKDPQECNLDALLKHVDHIIRKGGIDTCALGSDFDGFSSTQNSVIENASEYPLIYHALRKRGYNRYDTQKILGANMLRVISEVLG